MNSLLCKRFLLKNFHKRKKTNGTFKITVAALLLGCSMILVSAQSDRDFQFTDSRGQCWRCAPGMPCERCNSLAVPPFPNVPQAGPIPWPEQCVTPNCNDLRNSGQLSVVLPSVDSKYVRKN
jgi:hypothetical protein